ncbi:cation:dicarboxylase symporter family transporter [Endozoicomonas sp. GU-1]|uniref:L-cystine transporter n=1 Tax=Endozoicomonas sp. GU-1 TaxID=3009078 RepID=UPI0022B36191|nr:cation:dicarboxylase symporter family transporter [Endozoicomonas sp. GU-1]WBA80944.1 cation:dicarboxylase symporter family transporter [Endozoicomonas sp. GU-1]WBA88512.1 cation:dicarboxylase symporter family transporter [Endozoicomonas sp. GU-1]
MSLAVLTNIFIMVALLYLLYRFQKHCLPFSWQVFIALGMGVGYGACLQLFYGYPSETLTESINWFNIVGNGYVSLLKMIIVPLVMVSVISAILKLKGAGTLGRISGWILTLLMVTVSIAAAIGIISALGFGLSAESITSGVREAARGEQLLNTVTSIENLSIPSMLISLIPANPFMDMTGARSTSIIGVVIFSAFIGVAVLSLHSEQPEEPRHFERTVNAVHAIVMRIMTMVLNLTPFGILALMTKVVAGSNVTDILQLLQFVIASYAALLAVLVVHLIMITMVGANPIRFIRKTLPVLIFAFTSRSSAGTMPLTIQTLTKGLGVSAGVANFAASFGTTIGQNGCAGIYPAMLAVMIAPTVGIDPTSLSFIDTLIVTIAIGSFGVAGVGGGATFAALIVLSALGLPVELAGLLISIEPVIDMGRTVVNVSGAITTGFVSGRAMGEVDMDTFNRTASLELNQ